MVTRFKRSRDSLVNFSKKRNLVEKMLTPLVAVYKLVSGPPLTHRQRSSRDAIEASIRMSVSVNPYHLTLWR